MSLNVTIRGAGRVINNTNEFEKKIIKAVKKSMIESALIDIETGSKRKLTSDGHIDTGRLRASIHTEYPSGDGVEGVSSHSYRDSIGNTYTSSFSLTGDFKVVVGTDVYYAPFIEILDSFIFYAFNKAKVKLKNRITRNVGRVLRGR